MADYAPLRGTISQALFGERDKSLCSHSHIENDKVINFKEMLQEYRNRTEFSVPYTIMQVEDVIFVNEKKLIALEYIFYNKEGNYSKIVKD